MADAWVILASDWLQVPGAEDLWLQQRRLRLLSQERGASLHLHRAQAAGARHRHVPLPQVTPATCHTALTRVLCHVRTMVCEICGATGDQAHTKTYCPHNQVSRVTSLPALLSNTLRRSPARWRCPRCCAPPSTSQTAGSGGGTRAGPPGPSRATARAICLQIHELGLFCHRMLQLMHSFIC